MKFIVLVCISLLSIFASDSAVACMMSGDEKATLFDQFDDNKDEKISQEEYVTHEGKRVFNGRPVDVDFLKKRYTEQMDTQNKGSVELQQFSPISLQKCM